MPDFLQRYARVRVGYRLEVPPPARARLKTQEVQPATEALGDFVEQYAHACEASPLPDVNPQAGGAGGKPCSAAENHHLLDLMQNTR